MAVVIGTSYTGTVEPLTNPRVCWQAHTATVTADRTAAGTDAAWLGDGETWNPWASDTTFATVTLDFGEALTVDYVGIAAHNFGTVGATVRPLFQASDGGAFSVAADVLPHSPTDDSAILFLFEPRTVWGVQVSVYAASAPPSAAVMQAGEAMEWPRKSLYTGTPISESEQVRYRQLQSVRGDVIGRAVEGAELAFDVQISNLSEAFRAGAAWRGFKDHITDTGPFFIAPKPQQYPADVAYAQCSERPRFDRLIPRASVTGGVTLRCMGYKAP